MADGAWPRGRRAGPQPRPPELRSAAAITVCGILSGQEMKPSP